MKLLEHEGKELFKKYNIPVPKSELVFEHVSSTNLTLPIILKAQVPSGNRKKDGGIIFVDSLADILKESKSLFSKKIGGSDVKALLFEEKINFVSELYVSLSYDTKTRGPVLALSLSGGSGIEDASVFPVNIIKGLEPSFLNDILDKVGVEKINKLIEIINSLWNLFIHEKALLVEINPLFITQTGECVAGDAKIILDDAVSNPSFRPYLDLDGDIAVIASGGGASLINLDDLMSFGGRPANYVEYSGNPPAEVVKNITKKVLSKPNLKGCLVIGGTANFTDIHETMLGFVQGLREINPKPNYPIVIRRDGPKQKQAFLMLREVGEKEGFDFHLFDSRTSMSQAAKKIVELTYKKETETKS